MQKYLTQRIRYHTTSNEIFRIKLILELILL